MRFDMGRAWSEGIARLQSNFSLLAILGGVFFFLPAMVMFLAVPDVMGPMMGGQEMDPEDMAALFENVGATFFLAYLLVFVASMIGYVAMVALIGDGEGVSVGQAIATGFKALLPLIAIMLIFLVGYFLFALVIGLIIGVVIAGIGSASSALAGIITFILVVGIVLALLWVMTRFSMTMPVIAIERVMNPFTALRRSWRMTAPVQARLFLFYVLLFVAYIVIAIVVFMIIGLIASAAGAPSVLGFLNGITGALVAMVFSGIVVAIYAQLVGSSPANLGDTFE